MRHHRHTPIIHLPTFNVSETATSLIFALALVAASYTPSLGLRAKDIMSLIQFAYRLTLDSDQVNGGQNLHSIDMSLTMHRLSTKAHVLRSHHYRPWSFSVSWTDLC
jgi:hypothetical protein